MKRVVSVLFALVTLLSVASCSFSEPEGFAAVAKISKVECVMEDFEPDDVTKVHTIKSGNNVSSTWEAGDVIGVFPDQGGDQVSFTVSAGAGTANCSFTGEGWGLIASAKYSAYYPYSKNNYGDANAWKNAKVSYVGQSQSAKNTFGVGKYDCMACTNAVPSFATEDSGKCTFTFKHLGALLIFNVTFPAAANLSALELVCEDDVFTETGTVDLSQTSAAITPSALGNTLTLNLEGMPVSANETVTFYMMAAPCSMNDKMPTLRAVTTTGAVMAKKLTSSYNFKAGRAYTITTTLKIAEDEQDGLPQTIHNGDRILVTNSTVEQFLTEVHYPVKDYTYTSVLNYPVAPGDADMPPSFTIRWYIDAPDGDLVASLWEDGWCTECTLDPADGKHWVVTNLRPNAHYGYRVSSAASGTVLTEGEFDTYGHLHQLFFESEVRNVRDLGGWKTRAGKTVKYRKLYRGGRMSPKHLTQAGKQALLSEGIRAQLDLRGTDRISSCAFGSQYDFFAPGLTAGYLTMLGTDSDKTKECFEFVVNCLRDDKPVYFHCTAGRDRTGTMALLLLGVLDVPEGDISQEYELSLFAPLSWSINENETTIQTRLVSYKTTTNNYLWNFANGNTFALAVQAYLLSIGVSQTDIDDFRTLMLE